MSISYSHPSINGRKEINLDFFKDSIDKISKEVSISDLNVEEKMKLIHFNYAKMRELTNDFFFELCSERKAEIIENIEKINSESSKNQEEFDRLVNRNNYLISSKYQPRDISDGFYFLTLLDAFDNFCNFLLFEKEKLEYLYCPETPKESLILSITKVHPNEFLFKPLVVRIDILSNVKKLIIDDMQEIFFNLGKYSDKLKRFIPIQDVNNHFSLMTFYNQNPKINVTSKKIQYLVDYAIELQVYLTRNIKAFQFKINFADDNPKNRKNIKDFIIKYFVFRGSKIDKKMIEVQIKRAIDKRAINRFHKSIIEFDFLISEWEELQNSIS